VPGFSGEVRLGEIGSVLGSHTPALRVRIVDSARPLSLKWRGAALSGFDGKRWTEPTESGSVIPVGQGRAILADDDQRRRAGARITYEVQLESAASGALFFAGTPEVLWVSQSSVRRSPSGVYRLDGAPGQRPRYGAISYLDAAPPESRPPVQYLQLPLLDDRIPALARQAAAGAARDYDRAVALETYLRSRYRYTTELPSAESSDPLAQFLFERRQGHCEYFASSMVVMLRALGIPSRLVTGFQGGTLNPITGWYVVRAGEAHAWVEAWIEGGGWTTFDPTPGSRGPGPHPWLSQVLFYTDAAEMFWQNWVVGYDLERQVTLAARMQSSGHDLGARWVDRFRMGFLGAQAAVLRALRDYGAAALALLLLAAALRLLAPRLGRVWQVSRRVRKARRGEGRASDATLLYERMLGIMKRHGYSKPAWATPGEFVHALPSSETADLVARFTTAYHDLRYGGSPDAATRMITLLDLLEKA
jgi:transglutaminase-like putative cysteine protease